VVDYVHLFFGEVFDIQAFSPVASFHFGARYHGALLTQTVNYFIESGMSMTLLYSIDSNLVNGFDDFHIHGIFTGSIAAAAHIAVVDNLHQFGGIAQTVFEQLGAHNHTAAAAIGMEIIFSDTGTNIYIVDTGDFFERNEFAR
jgi:hypothetical protein